jgi:hypothetical protein
MKHRSVRTAAAVLLRLCLCGPAAHAFGERSTTALDRRREGEKAFLPLILRLTPSEGPLPLPQLAGLACGRRWRPHGAAHAGRTRSGPVDSLAADPAWGQPSVRQPAAPGPARSGSCHRSGAQRPDATGRARGSGRSSPCMLIIKVDYRSKA